jgi:hypothetical protein
MKESMAKTRKIEDLVKAGSRLVPVPAGTREKVLGLILERARSRPRPSFAAILRYTPAYALVLAFVIALPVASVLGWQLFSSLVPDTRLLVVSDRGGSVSGIPGKLYAGRVVRESEVMVTGSAEQVSLRSKQFYDLHMFSGSELEVSKYVPDTRAIDLLLREGSLYVNEYGIVSGGRLVTVRIDRYECVLTGTRVYFAVSAKRIIRIICFDGRVEVSSESDGEKKILFTLAKGEKAEIALNGRFRILHGSSFTSEELDFDALLASRFSPAAFYMELPWREWNDESNRSGKESREAAAPTEEPLPPYSVQAVCNIAPKTSEGENARFYASAWLEGRLFLMNRESVFALAGGKPVRVSGIPGGATFRVRPVETGNRLCIPTVTALLFADPVSLSVAESVPLPPDGSIDHDFVPFFDSGILYVPVQNYGYYTMDAQTGTPSLGLLIREPFPVSPQKREGRLYVGSYYDNYVAAYDGQGAEVFKVRVPGGNFTNFELDESGVYVQALGPGTASIARISPAGEENGMWPIPGELKADFIVFDGKIAGITEGGLFFVLDTASGLVTMSKKVFGAKLTTREWRTIGLLLADGKLYVQSDSGSIYVVDPARAAVEDEIPVNPNDALYAPPVSANGVLYCIGNGGTVYEIVKNER